ncbi:RNA polymerase sigma factor [Sphingomonas sp. KC8]|uniref:RNA polymerase sigma factor n=1 Tax=Sphingomonas sp. KC8 TaxID=1030157 RepID=UPI000248869B|nr:sigma-70 family RNA polymerase sigma factor [Sphingomonas sp. KC8]ARS28715.1 RNA polymerase subunit sigma-24 [Sphingomonas sp. KC8]
MEHRASDQHLGETEKHDRRWLEAVARRYTQALSRFFERRIDQKSDVPDLVQDVFLRLSRLNDHSAIEKPENYLFRTASNALRDHFRRNAVRPTHAAETFLEHHGGSDFSPTDVLEGRQSIVALQAALRELPERTRDVFVLKMLEGHKTADVARTMGISTRAIEKHFAKALAHVSQALAAYRD